MGPREGPIVATLLVGLLRRGTTHNNTPLHRLRPRIRQLVRHLKDTMETNTLPLRPTVALLVVAMLRIPTVLTVVEVTMAMEMTLRRTEMATPPGGRTHPLAVHTLLLLHRLPHRLPPLPLLTSTNKDNTLLLLLMGTVTRSILLLLPHPMASTHNSNNSSSNPTILLLPNILPTNIHALLPLRSPTRTRRSILHLHLLLLLLLLISPPQPLLRLLRMRGNNPMLLLRLLAPLRLALHLAHSKARTATIRVNLPTHNRHPLRINSRTVKTIDTAGINQTRMVDHLL